MQQGATSKKGSHRRPEARSPAPLARALGQPARKAADSPATRLADKEQHQKKRAANQADPEKAAENAATRKKNNEQHKDKRNKERAAGEVRQTKVTLRRANMTEAERRAKKQLESGSRFDQDRATRLRDERLRVYRQRHPENGAPPIRATCYAKLQCLYMTCTHVCNKTAITHLRSVCNRYIVDYTHCNDDLLHMCKVDNSHSV